MSINIKPLGDRVLVEAVENKEEMKGGIYIPDSAKEKPQEAKVVAVGPGKKDEPMTVKVGQKVLTAKFGGQEIKLDEQDYMVCKLSDILAIVE